MLNALLQLRIRVLVSAVAAVVACGLAVVLVPAMGVAGLCLGLCVGRLVQSVGLPLAVNGALGRAPVAGWRSCFRPAAASSLLAASVLVEPRLHAANWFALGGGIVATGTLLLPAAAATGLTPHQRAGVWQRVTDVARGRSATP